MQKMLYDIDNAKSSLNKSPNVLWKTIKINMRRGQAMN